MSKQQSPEDQAIHDLLMVKEFRVELGKGRPLYKNRADITATETQMAAERERQEYAMRQRQIVTSLAVHEPLYTWRLEVERPGDRIRIYLSPIGREFTPVTSDEGDDYLVSWAHPDFLGLRNLELGESGRLARGKNVDWVLVARTELAREDRDIALYDLKVLVRDIGETLFEEVRFVDGQPITIVAGADRRVPEREAVEPVPAEEIFPQEEIEKEVELEQRPRLALETIVRNSEGRAVAIPFALDEHQWDALRRYAGDGTILMTGPPGTGKTTVALLRATTLIHSTFDYDIDGKRRSDLPLIDIRKHRFRIIVVTEHLRSYLKEFLSSPELGLPEAQVVNLRGAFLENFVRHKTLSTWIRGLRFRLSKAKNRQSDALVYIKSLRETLQLCFYHAVLNAEENAGEQCRALRQRVFDRVSYAIETAALNHVLPENARKELREQGTSETFDLDSFLAKHDKNESFDAYVDPRLSELRQSLRQLQEFVMSWIKRAQERCDQAIGAAEEVWLVPNADDLLLSRFVEDLGAIHTSGRGRNLFIREAWRELVNLVDPQEVLLRVISEFETTGDIQSLEAAGLDREDALAGLSEWRQVISGTTAVQADDDEGDETATLDDLEEDTIEDDAVELVRRKGSLTRTDFPLLASLARVFLAVPPEAKQSPDMYKGVGFLLPDDLPRYDHVIIDEGQDFTYAEIHLVRSLVEAERKAVTVSGDPFQRMDWRSGFSSLETIPATGERTFHITKNYRQTVELTDWLLSLGNALFPDSSLVIESGHNRGPTPEVVVEPSLRKGVHLAANSIRDWYADDRNPFVSMLLVEFAPNVMTKLTNSLSDELEEDVIRAERVEDGRQLERGVVAVSTVPTVKGLEFDGVVVVVNRDACKLLSENSPQATIAKNKLYVACSRAKQNLLVILQQEVDNLRDVVV